MNKPGFNEWVPVENVCPRCFGAISCLSLLFTGFEPSFNGRFNFNEERVFAISVENDNDKVY